MTGRSAQPRPQGSSIGSREASAPTPDGRTVASDGAGVAPAADRIAVVDGTRRWTHAQLLADARRLGSALQRHGLRPGAAVAFQLPNWYEGCVINLAASLHGFVLVPLLPMYREAELALILGECDVQAVFIPQVFRGFSFLDLFERLRPRPRTAGRVFLVRAEAAGHPSFGQLLEQGDIHRELPPPPDPAAAKVVLHNSGSTGKPKGVVHTHASMASLVRFAADFWGLTDADVLLVPSPVAHIGGSLYAFELPRLMGVRAVLMDHWDPAHAVRLIDAERVSFLAGATPFLDGLVHAAEGAHGALASLRRFVCGGASVPPALVRRAAELFPHCLVSRAYGSTEVPLICPGIRTHEDAAFGASTEGECAADVMVLDEQGCAVAPGQPGEIVARAPRMFARYLDPRDNQDAFTPEGYFRMGDIGRVVAGRFLEVTGRKKEIIIRSGENISPLEVENALMSHPAIRRIAIVGIPDARTGEAAMAFVEVRDGCVLELADLQAHLQRAGLARQKWPEHLRVVAALPTNSIGKVLKRELVAWAASAPG